MTDVVTVLCQACGGTELATDQYEAGQEPTERGLCAGVGSRHAEKNPGHALTYRRETVAEAEARRAGEAEAEHVRRRHIIEAERRRRIDRAGARFAALADHERRRIIRG